MPDVQFIERLKEENQTELNLHANIFAACHKVMKREIQPPTKGQLEELAIGYVMNCGETQHWTVGQTQEFIKLLECKITTRMGLLEQK